MLFTRNAVHSAKVQKRVIGALLMREIITRYGRHNFGFLWMLLEPIIFTLGVVLLWSLMHRTSALKVDVAPFAVTGYSCLLLWRTCTFRGIKSIESNLSLLHHRPVKIIDIFITRMLLEVSGVTASFTLVVITMITFGFMEAPFDVGLLLLGWILMAWLSAATGVVLGCLSEFTDVVERLWHPISYFMLPVSGVFFLVDWLPRNFQSFVLLFPIVHPVEMVRAGHWGGANYHYDISYITVWCLALTLFALILMAHPKLKNLV